MPSSEDWLTFLKPYCLLPHFTVREIAVLLILHTQGKATFNEIPGLLKIPAPSTCRAIDRLCIQGFAHRSRDKDDQRKSIITITAPGRTFAEGLTG